MMADQQTLQALSRRAFLSGTVACAGALLVACGQGAAPASAPPSAAASSKPAAAGSSAASPAASAKPSATANQGLIKAAWVAPAANQMLWPLAVEAGYFDKYGLKVDLSYINGSITVVPALLSGEVQLACTGGQVVVGARGAKQDVIMAASFQNDLGYRVVAAPSIKTVEDLKGKTVTITAPGRGDHFAFILMTQKLGWKPDDLKYVNGGDDKGVIALVQNGGAVALAGTPPNEVLA